MIFLILKILMVSLMSLNAQEKSAFEQSLERDTGVESEEGWVDVKGIRYRKIVFDGAVYYIRFSKPESMTAELHCQPPFGHESEKAIEDAPKVIHRARPFLQAFHEACKDATTAKSKVTLHLKPEIDLTYPGYVPTPPPPKKTKK